MSTIFAHWNDGAVTVKSDDHHIVFEVPATLPDAPPGSTATPATPPKSPPKPRKIQLGPRPGYPLPASIVVTRSVGRQNPLSVLVNLNEEIKRGELSDGVQDMIRKSAELTLPGLAVSVEAFLPPGFSVDVNLLSNHFAQVAREIGREVALRVGTEIARE